MSERGTALQRCGLGSRADGGFVTAVVTDGSIRTERRTSGGLTEATRGLMFALLVGRTPTPRPADLGPSGRLYALHTFIVQNARNETDTGVPGRHTSLNPRALAVQVDTSEEFL